MINLEAMLKAASNGVLATWDMYRVSGNPIFKIFSIDVEEIATFDFAGGVKRYAV